MNRSLGYVIDRGLSIAVVIVMHACALAEQQVSGIVLGAEGGAAQVGQTEQTSAPALRMTVCW